ncbi:MAG: peptidylprolyl isomerase [Hyphomonadaceae bacterium]|nr:peptidylprolyl isomerase [Hyphomonadaceae bacterium]
MGHERPGARALAIAGALAAALLAASCGERPGGAGAGPISGPADPVVAATVDGAPIYREDVRAYAVERNYAQDGEDLPEDSDAYHLALQELIERKLFAAEAERRGLDRDAEVRRAIAIAREQVLARAIMREIDDAATDPDTLDRLYRENARALGQPTEVHLRHIQFESREAALAAKRRLDQGERFAALAFELSTDRISGSEGGDLGYALLDNLPDGLRETAESTPVGAIGGPVRSEVGWHLVLLEDRRERGQPSFADLRDQMVDWLRFQETNRLRARLEGRARVELRSAPEPGMAPAGDVTAPEDAPAEAPAIAERPGPSAPAFPFPAAPEPGAAGAAATVAQERPLPPAQRPAQPAAAETPARPRVDPSLLPGAPAPSP